jgi:predicted secreted protein
MAATSGRDFVILKAGTAIAGLRENSLALDGSPVDVTTKGDSGFRTIADFAGVKSFDISASGVLEDDILQDLALNPSSSLLLTDVTIEFADGAIVDGDVYLASADFSGAHDGENTYDVSLQSSGEWVYTPAA